MFQSARFSFLNLADFFMNTIVVFEIHGGGDANYYCDSVMS